MQSEGSAWAALALAPWGRHIFSIIFESIVCMHEVIDFDNELISYLTPGINKYIVYRGVDSGWGLVGPLGLNSGLVGPLGLNSGLVGPFMLT